jgi:Meckel syndrome type 1 protein
VGQSLASELRRFFIGGSPELEDATFVGTPSTFHGSHLSKYGFRTISTGNIAVKIRTMQQSQ